MVRYEHTSNIQQGRPIHSNNTILTSNGPREQSIIRPMVQRFLSTDTVDISSKKGRFAWEKLPYSDIYIPVIFR